MASDIETIDGVLSFHTETGTEGGYWAFQDKRYISLVRPDYCNICGLYLGDDRDIINSANQKRLQSGKVCSKEIHDQLEEEQWSYDGLHILKNGDFLKIFLKDKSRHEIWAGDIHLQTYPPFQETVFALWIHSDQIGVDRKIWGSWFFNKHPATLVLAPK